MRRVHFDDCLPDYGGSGAPACRKSGHVLGPERKNNPIYFDATTDSALVTCKACIKVLARRTEAHVSPRVLHATDVEIAFKEPSGKVTVNKDVASFSYKTVA